MTADAIEGFAEGYVPCDELAALTLSNETGAIVGSDVGYVPVGATPESLSVAERGAIVGSAVGFVPGPCGCSPLVDTFTRTLPSSWGTNDAGLTYHSLMNASVDGTRGVLRSTEFFTGLRGEARLDLSGAVLPWTLTCDLHFVRGVSTTSDNDLFYEVFLGSSAGQSVVRFSPLIGEIHTYFDDVLATGFTMTDPHRLELLFTSSWLDLEARFWPISGSRPVSGIAIDQFYLTGIAIDQVRWSFYNDGTVTTPDWLYVDNLCISSGA